MIYVIHPDISNVSHKQAPALSNTIIPTWCLEQNTPTAA